MISFIEPLYKSIENIQFGWRPEPGATGYKMYVGLAASSLTALYDGIPNIPSPNSQDRGKISYAAQIADVRTKLSLSSDKNFGNTVFYFAITYYNASGSESLTTNSTIVEVPPVGITPRFMKDDPSINRHNFAFCPSLQKWVKIAGTSSGATVVDSADFFKYNLTTEYTYDTTKISTIKSYPSDATTPGSPAKLTTYSYTGSLVSKIVITDSTV